MIQSLIVVLLLTGLFAACAPVVPPPASPTPTLTSTPFVLPPAPVPPTPTPAPNPAPTAIPTVPPDPRQAWAEWHERERLRRLAEQGPATGIPALEYHGDNYSFTIDGALTELSPEGFSRQMEWFCANDYHAVSGTELIAWLNGRIHLPRKSVLLTFDMGARSSHRLDKMLADFTRCNLHAIITIFPEQTMNSPLTCPHNACWEAYRRAYLSGRVTIGSHSLTHRDFRQVEAADGLDELHRSRLLLEEKIGYDLVVNILSWPYEAVPTWAPRIAEIGFEAAFGGREYPILDNHAKRDGRWYGLPRVMPPNSNGISGRPCCYTLEGMMQLYTKPGSNP